MARSRHRDAAALSADRESAYRAPWKWRWVGVPQMCIFVPAVIGMMFEYPPTWTWTIPIAAEAIMVGAMIMVWRARIERDAIIAVLILAVCAIGALFLLGIPASAPAL